MLMVGTLQCKGGNATAVEQYNRFVTKQRGLLDANNYVLKAHFMREAGIENGSAAYDGYATSLANNRAARLGDPGFCPTVETFVTLAEAASAPELQRLAEMVSEPPDSGTCPPSNWYAGTGGPAVAAPTATVQPAVAVETVAPPAPTPGNAEALQAAIVALQNATAALQAASASATTSATPPPIPQTEGGPKVVTVADAPVIPPADPQPQ